MEAQDGTRTPRPSAPGPLGLSLPILLASRGLAGSGWSLGGPWPTEAGSYPAPRPLPLHLPTPLLRQDCLEGIRTFLRTHQRVGFISLSIALALMVPRFCPLMGTHVGSRQFPRAGEAWPMAQGETWDTAQQNPGAPRGGGWPTPRPPPSCRATQAAPLSLGVCAAALLLPLVRHPRTPRPGPARQIRPEPSLAQPQQQDPWVKGPP